MSVCVSRHGEFGSHDLDDEHTCRLCGALDEDALRVELRQLRATVPALAEARERRVPLTGQKLVRIDFTAEYENDHEFVAELTDANAVTSIVDAGGLSHLGGDFASHKVVLDVDLPCALVASSTPGHHHLFIDKAMPWATYVGLLEALTVACIVEPGYLAAALSRGHTAVRLPWVRKAIEPSETEIAASFAALMPPATD